MSLPYSVAVAWIAGRVGLTEYEEPWIHDPAVRAFMSRVTVSGDPALPEGAEAHVTVETRDGRRFDRHVPFARGAPENPLSLEEVIAKYEELAPRALAPRRCPRSEGGRLRPGIAGASPAAPGRARPSAMNRPPGTVEKGARP